MPPFSCRHEDRQRPSPTHQAPHVHITPRSHLHNPYVDAPHQPRHGEDVHRQHDERGLRRTDSDEAFYALSPNARYRQTFGYPRMGFPGENRRNARYGHHQQLQWADRYRPRYPPMLHRRAHHREAEPTYARDLHQRDIPRGANRQHRDDLPSYLDNYYLDSDSDVDNLEFRTRRNGTYRGYDISSDDESEDDFVRLPRGRARRAQDDGPLVDDVLLGDFGDGVYFSPRGRSRQRTRSGGNARVRDQSSEDRRRVFGRWLW
ncbi:hypothetical protein FQN50_009612 [Emmonsiellopsis sp. PD_5]|nr:hypothetical protein FQN50_009612 [Emmonsiellopsis sp. PD_5]